MHRTQRPGAGSRVALISPSGPIDSTALDRARQRCAALRWTAVVNAPQTTAETLPWLAAPDDDRLAELESALADPSIAVIWPLRGGSGVTRILPRLNRELQAASHALVIGFSDNTGLLCARVGAGHVALHGPHSAASLWSLFTASAFEQATLGEPFEMMAPDGVTLRQGRANGTLVGGNLSLLCALAGTPDFPTGNELILFLEDVNEATYRLDRMMVQLESAGLLQRTRGLVLGQFTERGSEPSGHFELWMRDLSERLDIPVLANAPIGHVDDQWTLPVGAKATLNATARTLTVDERFLSDD